jgi:hypothetical protein
MPHHAIANDDDRFLLIQWHERAKVGGLELAEPQRAPLMLALIEFRRKATDRPRSSQTASDLLLRQENRQIRASPKNLTPLRCPAVAIAA